MHKSEVRFEELQSLGQTSDATGSRTGAQPVSPPLSKHSLTHSSFSSRREGAASSLVSYWLCPQGYYCHPNRSPRPGPQRGQLGGKGGGQLQSAKEYWGLGAWLSGVQGQWRPPPTSLHSKSWVSASYLDSIATTSPGAGETDICMGSFAGGSRMVALVQVGDLKPSVTCVQKLPSALRVESCSCLHTLHLSLESQRYPAAAPSHTHSYNP